MLPTSLPTLAAAEVYSRYGDQSRLSVCVSVSVGLRVRALKGKRLELSTPKSVNNEKIVHGWCWTGTDRRRRTF